MRLAAAKIYRAMGFFSNSGVIPPGTGNHILTEGGDNLALENGDLLITET